MACTIFGAVAPNDPDVLPILNDWRTSCRAAGKFPRARHLWRMITLYCCDGPSDPLPSAVAIDIADLAELTGERLDVSLSDRALGTLMAGGALGLPDDGGQIRLIGCPKHVVPSKEDP